MTFSKISLFKNSKTFETKNSEQVGLTDTLETQESGKLSVFTRSSKETTETTENISSYSNPPSGHIQPSGPLDYADSYTWTKTKRNGKTVTKSIAIKGNKTGMTGTRDIAHGKRTKGVYYDSKADYGFTGKETVITDGEAVVDTKSGVIYDGKEKKIFAGKRKVRQDQNGTVTTQNTGVEYDMSSQNISVVKTAKDENSGNNSENQLTASVDNDGVAISLTQNSGNEHTENGKDITLRLNNGDDAQLQASTSTAHDKAGIVVTNTDTAVLSANGDISIAHEVKVEEGDHSKSQIIELSQNGDSDPALTYQKSDTTTNPDGSSDIEASNISVSENEVTHTHTHIHTDENGNSSSKSVTAGITDGKQSLTFTAEKKSDVSTGSVSVAVSDSEEDGTSLSAKAGTEINNPNGSSFSASAEVSLNQDTGDVVASGAISHNLRGGNGFVAAHSEYSSESGRSISAEAVLVNKDANGNTTGVIRATAGVSQAEEGASYSAELEASQNFNIGSSSGNIYADVRTSNDSSVPSNAGSDVKSQSDTYKKYSQFMNIPQPSFSGSQQTTVAGGFTFGSSKGDGFSTSGIAGASFSDGNLNSFQAAGSAQYQFSTDNTTQIIGGDVSYSNQNFNNTNNLNLNANYKIKLNNSGTSFDTQISYAQLKQNSQTSNTETFSVGARQNLGKRASLSTSYVVRKGDKGISQVCTFDAEYRFNRHVAIEGSVATDGSAQIGVKGKINAGVGKKKVSGTRD